MALARQEIGIDLGTANVLVFVKRKGIAVNEPSVVAIDNDTQKILAVGEQAQQMVGRTPANISAVRPLRDGVIADYEVTEAMLKHYISKVCGKSTLFKPMVVICVPAQVTSVQRRAVVDAAMSAGAKQAFLIEEPMAAAIGAGLAVQDARGSMVVDIGGGTTDIAVISLGGIVVSESIRVAGNKLDDAIVRCVRKNYNLLIGERTAEAVKLGIGSAYPLPEQLTMEVRGRDLVDGLPKAVTMNSDEVREALEEPVTAIVDAVKAVLERTPPELASDIIESGIVLTGGGALLRGLDTLLTSVTRIPVKIANDPISCVAVGTGKIEAGKICAN